MTLHFCLLIYINLQINYTKYLLFLEYATIPKQNILHKRKAPLVGKS